MIFLMILLGAVIASPIAVLITLRASRRTWRSTRRLAARARDTEHIRELSQLTGGLAHEIKNPLSTINMNLKLLAEDLEHNDSELHRRWRRRLESVQHETERLRAILDDFLRYAGKHELQLQDCDLRTLVEELTDFFTPQAAASNVIMRTSLGSEAIGCSIDTNLIKQALLNLMINAVDAMSDGGELMISVSSAKGKGVIEVTDTGPGIKPDDLPHVFGVYFSTKSGGSGLGLPTSRRIIREHGGNITVESEPGKGSQFTIALPLDQPLSS
ncbi:MAG: two-component sensor histidine kinase [Phycisphaerales bacterium]|jgi:two-component system, NtrC family, sensor histidine kinase HydH|nr:two-component sensor histidine kinase [Phycisphaerales bacterium]